MADSFGVLGVSKLLKNTEINDFSRCLSGDGSLRTLTDISTRGGFLPDFVISAKTDTFRCFLSITVSLKLTLFGVFQKYC